MRDLLAVLPSNHTLIRALRLLLSALRDILSSQILTRGHSPDGPKRSFGNAKRLARACPTGTARRKFKVPMKRAVWNGNQCGEMIVERNTALASPKQAQRKGVMAD